MGKESWQQGQRALEPGREPGVLCLRVQSVVGEAALGRKRRGARDRQVLRPDKHDWKASRTVWDQETQMESLRKAAGVLVLV